MSEFLSGWKILRRPIWLNVHSGVNENRVPFVTKIIKKIKEMWGLDMRSLALFRIAAAICLIGDLGIRGSDLVAHYTDSGVLPRSFFIDAYANNWLVSLHMLSGHWQVQAVLFGLSFAFALMLLVGYRTRTAVFFSWLLLMSVQLRNPLVLQGGDVLFRMILFWSLFLPLGAFYSVDRAMASKPLSEEKTVFSMGTIAFILQIAFIYWFTAAIKMAGDAKVYWWDQGTAASIVLSADQFARPFGHYLLGFPQILKLLTRFTVVSEIMGPFLFFMPFWTAFFKLMGVFAFLSLHFTIALCMLIGPFTWIGCISILPMLPGVFWDKIVANLFFKKENHPQVYYDQDSHFCKKMVLLFRTLCFLPDESIHAMQANGRSLAEIRKKSAWVVVDSKGEEHTKFDAVLVVLRSSLLFYPVARLFSMPVFKNFGGFAYRILSRNQFLSSYSTTSFNFRRVKTRLSLIGNLVAAVAVVYVFFWNLGGLNLKYGIPVKWQGVGFALGLDQNWNMFAPPGTDDGWYVIPGKLRDGTKVDLFKDGEPVDFSKPQYVYRTYKNTRWNKYMYNIRASWFDKKYAGYYARYLCADWNANHPKDKLLDELDILFIRATKKPLMTPRIKKSLIWRYYCFTVPDPVPPFDPDA